MFGTLRHRITLTFGTLIAVVLLSVTAIEAYLAAARATSRLGRQMDSISAALADSRFPLTSPVLLQIKSYSGADFTAVDEQGRISASTFIEPPSPEFLAALPGKGERLGEPIEYRGKRYFFARTKVDGEPITVYSFYPESVWREDRRQAQYPHLLLGIAALAAAVAAAFHLAHGLTEPIRSLQRQVARVAEGDYRPVPPPETPIEMRSLAEAVNAMAAKIDAQADTLRRNERTSLIAGLSAGLAHHLRNAVAGARLAVQLHQDSCSGGDAESLAVALRQLRVTEEQVRRLLATESHDPERFTSIELVRLARECEELLAPKFRHRGVSLTLETSSTTIVVRGDREQLHQLLSELLHNALDAAGTAGWVKLTLGVRDKFAIQAVSDSGEGVPEAIRSRLFEPFVTGKSEGIGLGLAAARRICEAHGGTLRLSEARPTTFTAEIPLSKQEEKSSSEG